MYTFFPLCSRRRRGFSLVEVLVAITLVGAVFMAAAEVWPISARATAQGRAYLYASHAAQLQLESVIAAGYDRAASASGSVTATADVPALTWTTTVSLVGAQMKDVAVRVEWVERGGVRSVEYETLLSGR